ncbi:hypothetical protein U8527_11245 [Kordia algicida OT-1]|uniref:General secretion pathway protein n=1 Tax=Kordia algicida OT-1 TaxID=391587 RepID=A9CTW2_9FLAO|nr:hypothetical protein [Kordia algicida]EDP94150.1 hypothetical protein KAOT1_04747 [Kordia algicida OT-1]
MSNTLKNRLLIAGFIVVLFMCYKFAFAKTFELKAEHDALIKEQQIFKNTPKQLALLKKKKQYYDSLLTKYKIGGTSLQNNLLNKVTRFSKGNNLKVVDFSAPHVYTEKSLIINTYSFTVEGHFNNILQLIYTLEQRTKYGEIVSVSYEKKKNYRKGTSYLQATIILQSFG